MKERHNFYFAFGEYNSNLDLKQSKIYDGFKFNESASVQDFCMDVQKLVEIITDNNIDVIHVHPFYSVFPAVFAAKITNTPIVYSFHGYGSLNFPYQINDVILLQCMLESEIDKVFSVSELGVTAINTATCTNKTVFLPNSIDLEKYKKHNVINNKIWALVSRIDTDKIEEINKIISIIDTIDIEKICIYGDGNKKEELEQFIVNKGLKDEVILMGHSDNLWEELNGKYNGIIGIGRVAMEAISMGYPTMLIGYKKIAGIIDLKLYNLIKKYNFVNRMIPNIAVEELNKQLENVYSSKDEREILYNIFVQDFSAKNVYNQYEEVIKCLKNSSVYNFQKIYEELKNINVTNEEMYSSRLVYNILKKYIEAECLSTNLKNYFINFNNYFNLLDINYKENINIQNDIIAIKESLSKIEATLDSNGKNIDEVSAELEQTKESLNGINIDIKDTKANLKANLDEVSNQIKMLEDGQISLQNEQKLVQDRINIKFLTYNTIQRMKKKEKRKK